MYCFPNDPVDASGLLVKNTGAISQDTVACVDIVFGCKDLTWMLKPNRMIVLLDLGFDRIVILSNENPTTLARVAVSAWCFNG